jgi:hypothetical protein
MRQPEIDRIVAAIDETRTAELFRNPDRPSVGRRARRRLDPAIVKAKARARAAAWRNDLDRRGRPEIATIGMAMVRALVSARRNDLTSGDMDIVGRALVDLREAGYDLGETLTVLRRLRDKVEKHG